MYREKRVAEAGTDRLTGPQPGFGYAIPGWSRRVIHAAADR